jgi:hypothetical protein
MEIMAEQRKRAKSKENHWRVFSDRHEQFEGQPAQPKVGMEV